MLGSLKTNENLWRFIWDLVYFISSLWSLVIDPSLGVYFVSSIARLE